MYGCVQNIGAYEFKTIHMAQKFHSLTEFLLNYLIDVAICEQYILSLLKLIGFFMTGLWTQNILPLQFLQFSDKI
jgi:hypothetical protein